MNIAIICEKRSFTEIMSNRNQNIKDRVKLVKKSEKTFIKPISIFLAGCIATIVIGMALPNVFVLPSKVSNLEGKTQEIEDDVKNISSKIDTLIGSYEMYTGINLLTVSLHPSDSFGKAISQLNNGIEVTLLSDIIVGTDAITGQEYVMEDLVGQKILTSYVDDGMNVLFYGQYNKNGKWDGECLLNSYEETSQGNILRFIRESTYENGQSISSKQVYTHMVEKGTKKVWNISDRILNGEISIGDTCLYNKNADKIMNFSIDECLPKDMVTVEQFREEVALNPYGYYFGNISDGLYNDNTGNAFYISFFTNGRIRSIYSGNFKNGTFNDSTGNAWFLYKEKDDPYYTYRGGHFKGGRSVDIDSEEIIRNIDEKSIMDLIAEKDFDFAPMLEYFNIIWDFPETI